MRNLSSTISGYDTIKFYGPYPSFCHVYDSFYSGYSISIESENESEIEYERSSLFITRMSGNVPDFELDHLGTEGVEIDPVESDLY